MLPQEIAVLPPVFLALPVVPPTSLLPPTDVALPPVAPVDVVPPTLDCPALEEPPCPSEDEQPTVWARMARDTSARVEDKNRSRKEPGCDSCAICEGYYNRAQGVGLELPDFLTNWAHSTAFICPTHRSSRRTRCASLVHAESGFWLRLSQGACSSAKVDGRSSTGGSSTPGDRQRDGWHRRDPHRVCDGIVVASILGRRGRPELRIL